MRRKTIIALVLCSIIAFPLIFSGGLQAFQQYIKHTVTERLESEVLVTLTLPVSKVQWMEEGREIMVAGKMFDIKTYSEKDGIFTLTGVFDERETAVMELLNHFNDKQQNNFIIQLLLLVQSFVVALWGMNNIKVVIVILKHHSQYLIQKLEFFIPSFFTPPRRYFHFF